MIARYSPIASDYNEDRSKKYVKAAKSWFDIRILSIYFLLVFPCIFSSALIFPHFFSPFRVPLYLVSLIVCIPFLHVVPNRSKLYLLLLVGWLFVPVLLSGFWVSDSRWAVNLRQYLVFCSIFMCGIVGWLVVQLMKRLSVNYVEQFIILFSALFLYGIYTYYAQEFDLPEFLYFLRPNPALGDKIFSQEFFGWDSSMRAYSVWFEPSFSSLVFACVLPLLYYPASRRVKLACLVLSVIYGYLTYSRSAWFILGFFALGHFSGLFRLRLNALALISMAFASAVFIVLLQVIASSRTEEISALIRISSVVMGMSEWLNSPLFGTGQAELMRSLSFANIVHIHASIPEMMHWYGVFGLVFSLMPFWFLARASSKNRANISFIYLSILAITVGGALLMMSILWFFWGVYMASSINLMEKR